MLVKKVQQPKVKAWLKSSVLQPVTVVFFICYLLRLEILYYWHYLKHLKYFCLFGYYVRF